MILPYVLLGVLLAAASAGEAQQSARDGLVPCTDSLLGSLKAQCGSVQVRENRSLPDGRALNLRVVVIPPDSAGGELPDPIVIVPGGPGQGTIRYGGGWAGALKPARAHRALILHDPRGTGQSGALECELSDGSGRPRSYVHDFLPPARVRECAAELSRDANLTQYHSEWIADDLAQILTTLGYERANLYGLSGGTRQAFLFAQRHPARVRSLILGGVVGPGFKLPLHYARDFDRALGLLLADCARDSACKAAYPDPRKNLDRVVAKLEQSPALVELRVPGHPPDTARVTRDIFVEQLRIMLYLNFTAARVPFVLHRAAAGDFLPWIEPLIPGLGAPPGGDGIANGHYLAVTCSEDVDRITPAERQAAAAGTLLGDYRVQQQVDACKLWPHATLPDAHYGLKVLPIPALLISGDADPVTPPRWAEAIRQYLPSARHLVFPTGWHVPFGTPCALGLANQFIIGGDATGLDLSCAATLRRPPFKLP